jgi:hypothetical protein
MKYSRARPPAWSRPYSRKAADEGLSMDAIKKSVKHWRPDHDRL